MNIVNGSFAVKGNDIEFLASDLDGVYYYAEGLDGGFVQIIRGTGYTSAFFDDGRFYFSINDGPDNDASSILHGYMGAVYEFDPTTKKCDIIIGYDTDVLINGIYNGILYLTTSPYASSQEQIALNLEMNKEIYRTDYIFYDFDPQRGLFGHLIREPIEYNQGTSCYIVETKNANDFHITSYDNSFELPAQTYPIEFIYPYYIVEDLDGREFSYLNIETGEIVLLGVYYSINIAGDSLYFIGDDGHLFAKNLTDNIVTEIADLSKYFDEMDVNMIGIQLLYFDDNGGEILVQENLSYGILKVSIQSGNIKWIK